MGEDGVIAAGPALPRAAMAEGLAVTISEAELHTRIEEQSWKPVYRDGS